VVREFLFCRAAERQSNQYFFVEGERSRTLVVL